VLDRFRIFYLCRPDVFAVAELREHVLSDRELTDGRRAGGKLAKPEVDPYRELTDGKPARRELTERKQQSDAELCDR